MEVSALGRCDLILNQGSGHFPLEVDREALVQPEVLEVAVGDQVAGPAVHDLVDYDVRLAPVAGLRIW